MAENILQAGDVGEDFEYAHKREILDGIEELDTRLFHVAPPNAKKFRLRVFLFKLSDQTSAAFFAGIFTGH
jgi:hypothetical protein